MPETAVDLLPRVRALLTAGDQAGLARLAIELRAPEWAALVQQLGREEQAALLGALPDAVEAEVLAELDPAEAASILRGLNRHRAADLLEEMAPDDATDIVDALPAAEAEQILTAMAPAEAEEIRELLAYPEDSAGSVMTPAFVAIDPELRADQAIAALRRVAAEAETIYYVYVLDRDERLIGVLPLHQLVLSPPDRPVGDMMVRDVVRVRADADRETAARLLTDHHLLALPVVDEQERLLGIITQDDVADILEAETTEDITRLGGSEPLDVPYRVASVRLLVWRRIVWLLLLFAAEAYTGTVLRAYSDELEQVVALSFFIPLLIGTGGNVGSQTTTTLVRAMAVDDVRLRDVGWVLAKEGSVGVALGLVMAVVAYGRSQLLHVGADVGLVVALTIAAICVWAATVAAVLPMLLRRLRIDPAVVSAPFISTLVDGTGLVIYFTIAKVVLGL